MNEYYAKPDSGEEGSYKYHVLSCLEIASEFLALNSKSLEIFCEKVGMAFSDFEQLCIRAILYHDIGKLGYCFQKRMRTMIGGRPDEQSLYFRHELISAALLLQFYQKDNPPFPFDLWAVLGHHKKLEGTWKSFIREKTIMEPDSINLEQLQYALSIGEEKYPILKKLPKAIISKNLFVNDDEGDYNWVEQFLNDLSEQLPKRYDQNIVNVAKNRREISAFVRGILCYSDWQASTKPEERLKQCHSMTTPLLEERIRCRLKEKNNVIYKKRVFQEQCEACEKNVLAIAPTGSGKTEAALLWATRTRSNKILFFMPTKVTSNSLYERMKGYFDQNDCGITHSDVGVYLTLQDEKNGKISNGYDSQESNPNLIKYIQQYKAFMAPVTVSTVDQLLTANFNMGHWYFKELATLGASVIFDEIHAYDPFTLGLITESIGRIKELGGRVMVMSATMPNILKDHFITLLGVDAPIIAEELMDRKNCCWEYSNKEIESYNEEIKSALKNGRKVAIVVNTVAKAQELYASWKERLKNTPFEGRIMCYHSAFIMEDRNKKEEKLLTTDDLGRPKEIDILIATQAIEVSLDISFDFMYSECAPLDSLIQRAGRCNRKGKSAGARFIVFPVSDKAKDYVYKRSTHILSRTIDILQIHDGMLSEKELEDMLEEVYVDYNFYDHNDYIEAIKLVREVITDPVKSFYDEVDFCEGHVTRKMDYVKISIIPQTFYDCIKTLWSSKDQRDFYKISCYEVPISVSYLKNTKPVNVPSGMEFLNIYEIGYSDETGVQFPNSDADFVTG